MNNFNAAWNYISLTPDVPVILELAELGCGKEYLEIGGKIVKESLFPRAYDRRMSLASVR